MELLDLLERITGEPQDRVILRLDAITNDVERTDVRCMLCERLNMPRERAREVVEPTDKDVRQERLMQWAVEMTGG